MSLVVHDGPYAQSGGLRVGAPAFEFPFLQNGDTATLIVTRTYKQTRASYLTDRLSGTFKLGTVHDHEYTDAWLIAETAPSVTTSGLFGAASPASPSSKRSPTRSSSPSPSSPASSPNPSATSSSSSPTRPRPSTTPTPSIPSRPTPALSHRSTPPAAPTPSRSVAIPPRA
jgi:hypothetical protein